MVAALRRQLRWHSFCSSRETWSLARPCRAEEEPNALPSGATALCPQCTRDAGTEQLRYGRERRQGSLPSVARVDESWRQAEGASVSWWFASRGFSSQAAELAARSEQDFVRDLGHGVAGSRVGSSRAQQGQVSKAAPQTGGHQNSQEDRIQLPAIHEGTALRGDAREQKSGVAFDQGLPHSVPGQHRASGADSQGDQGGVRAKSHANASSHDAPAESVSIKEYLAVRKLADRPGPNRFWEGPLVRRGALRHHRPSGRGNEGREERGPPRGGGPPDTAVPLDRRKEAPLVWRGTRNKQADLKQENLADLKEVWIAEAAQAEQTEQAAQKRGSVPLKQAGGEERARGSPEDLVRKALVRAEAEALLTPLRKVTLFRKELNDLVNQGLATGEHLAAMCSVLSERCEERRPGEMMLLDVVKVLCDADFRVLPVAAKWATVGEVIHTLVRKGRTDMAKQVVNRWPSWQPTSRTQATRALISALMQGEAYQEAVAVFEEALTAREGQGFRLEQIQACGKELVQGLLDKQQLALAAQVTELAGRTGEYAPFVELIRTLGSQKRFLEAFYTLDKYCKAVETPDLATSKTLAAQYAEHGYEQSGVEFLQYATQAGSAPHAHVLWVLVRAYGLARLPHQAEEVVRLSAALGAEPDLDVQVALAMAHLDAGDVSKAAGLLEDVVTRHPRGTSRELSGALQLLLEAQCAAGSVGEGWRVLRWMDSGAVPYGIDSLTALFEAVLREGGNDVTQLMDAFDAHRRFLSSQGAASKVGTLLHKSLFQFLVSKGLLEDAVTVFDAGLKDGVSVPLTNCVRLIFDLIEAGHPSVALGVLNGTPELEHEYPKLYYKLLSRLTGRRTALPGR